MGDPHTFVVTVWADDGSGFVPANGVNPSVTLQRHDGGDINLIEDTCLSGTVNGDCEVTFSLDEAALVSTYAEVSIMVNGISLVRTPDGQAGNSSYALKLYVNGEMTVDIVPGKETVAAGDPSTLSATLTLDTGLTPGPVAGVPVYFTLTPSNGASLDDPDLFCVTNENGYCDVSLTSPDPGQVSAVANADIPIGNTLIPVTTDAPLVISFVDAEISIDFEPIADENKVSIGEPTKIIITVQGHDGTGWSAQTFEISDLTFSQEPDTVEYVDCPYPPDEVNGPIEGESCAITINSGSDGSFEINVTITTTINGVTLVKTDSATRIYVSGSLNWSKIDAFDQLLAGATFEACRTTDRTGVALEPQECQEATSQDGTFSLSELPLGTWTVEETQAPDGYHLDGVEREVALTTAVPDQDLGAFVNSRAGRLTVTGTTCEQYLDGSAVDITEVLYGVRDGVINNTAPGVFFYYTQLVTPSNADFSVEILQSSSPDFPLFEVQNDQQIRIFNGDCTAFVNPYMFDKQAEYVALHFEALDQDQTVVISVKYETGTVVGQEDPGTIHYTFETYLDAGLVDWDADGLYLLKKLD